MSNSSIESNADISLQIQNAVYISICIFAVIGNGLFLTSVLLIPKRRLLLSEYIVISLSFCDLLLVLTAIPLQVVELNMDKFPMGKIGCIIMYPLSTALLISATETLLFLSIERFVAIKHPFKYEKLKQYSIRVLICIQIVAVISIIPYASTLKVRNSNCVETWSADASLAYTIILFLIQYGIPLPIMIVLYTVVVIEVKKNNDQLIKASELRMSERATYNPALTRRGSNFTNAFKAYKSAFRTSNYKSDIAKRRQKQTLSIFKLFFAIVAVFAVCILPNQIVWLYSTFTEESVDPRLFTIAYWFTYTNSLLNPILYGLNARFRRLYKKLLKPCFRTLITESFISTTPNSETYRRSVTSKNRQSKARGSTANTDFSLGRSRFYSNASEN